MKRTRPVTLENFEKVTKYWGQGRRIYGKAALELGYQVIDYFTARSVHISNGKEHYFIKGFFTPLNSLSHSGIADNKHFTNEILAEAGIPSSKCTTVDRDQFKNGEWSAEGVPFPMVVKPLDSTAGGKDVMTNIRNEDELEETIASLLEKYEVLILEEFHDNLQDYRVLVLDGNVIGVVERRAAYITGNGKSAIAELIAEKNNERGDNADIKLSKIPMDTELVRKLEVQGMKLDSVPEKDARVRLRNVCNTGTGGDVADATDLICEENKELAKRVADTMGLRLVGLDFLCEDISKPLEQTRGVIIEVNQHPDITIHHFPHEGRARQPAHAILKSLFEEE